MKVSPRTEPQKATRRRKRPTQKNKKIISPTEIVRCLDEYVYGQQHAKECVGMICQNVQHRYFFPELELQKTNSLIAGPTGTGKTEMMKRLSEQIPIPFATLPMTTLSPTGYKGSSIEEVFYQLIPELGELSMEDIYSMTPEEIKGSTNPLLEHAIIYLDEIDKLGKTDDDEGFDEGLQDELIGLIEDASVFSGALSTRNMTFVGTGAFTGLEEIIRKRIKGDNKIGFTSAYARNESDPSLFAYTSPQDLVEYGFKPELVSRFPQRSYTSSLGVNELTRILDLETSTLSKNTKLLQRAYNISLNVSKGGKRAIAEYASETDTNARGLTTAVDKVLRPIMLNPEDYRNSDVKLTKKDIVYHLG